MDTKTVYNESARNWLRIEPSSLSDYTARPYLFDACGELNNKSVLDLGCGEGYCARELKRRGAGNYLGVDLSERMIEIARQQEEQDRYGIEYQCGNVLEFRPAKKYQLCIAVFLFNYLKIDEMYRIMAMVYESLDENGQFVFSVPHPFFPFTNMKNNKPFYFDAKGENYFDSVDRKFEGEIWKRNGESLHVQCIHKKFSDYFDVLREAGFSTIPEVEELTVTEEHIELDRDFFLPIYGAPLHVLFSVKK